MQPYTLFISDLHLDPSLPTITANFEQLLENQALQADALYILGDFFEMWIGDDDDSTFNQHIITSLRKLSDAGVPVYFMHGNRDFLIGKRFAKQTGITLLPDPCVIDLYGQPTLLTHGDYMCTLDEAHQRFRRHTNSLWFRFAAKIFTLKQKRRIAQKMRASSRTHHQKSAVNILDVHQPAVIDTFKKYEISRMIHGHTHRPMIHKLMLNDENGLNDPSPAERIVLGAWHDGTSYLKVNQDNSVLLVSP